MTDPQSQTERKDGTGAGKKAETEDETGTAAAAETADRAALTSRIGQLEAENRQLLRSVADTNNQQYRGTARGLIAVGLLCGAVGFATAGSDVLFALAGIGLFSGVLTYYLSPDRIVAADLGSRIYAATAQSYDELCADLGLSDRRLYVPVESTQSADAVRLFVPQQASMEPPTEETLQTGTFVVDSQTGSYGLAVHPTGGGLFGAFRTVQDGPLEPAPQAVAEQLSDAIVEDFELAQSVAIDTVDTDGDTDSDWGRLSVRFVDSLYEPRSGFDHPLVSFFAVGLAVALDAPIEATVTDTAPFSVSLRWEIDETAADAAESAARERPTAQPSAGAE